MCSVPMNYEIFSLWLLRTGTVSSPLSDSKLFPLILSGGSLSSLRWFSSMPVPFRTPVTNGGLEWGSSAGLWSSLSMQLSPVWYSVLQTLAVLSFLDYQVHLLNLEKLLGSTYVLPSCVEAWKLFADSKLRQP